jgi:peroxiredoxin (alkyl hydroperoxide reductase subunit C)
MHTIIWKKIPIFSATAVIDSCSIVQNFSLEQFFERKYVVLFFYSKNFAFVCPV